jgi:hypothetical protein
MRRRPFSGMLLGAGLLGPVGIAANDTGGIIPWSPDAQRAAFTVASEQCARYNKYARITSVHAQPGDYIGFRCVWSPHVRP